TPAPLPCPLIAVWLLGALWICWVTWGANSAMVSAGACEKRMARGTITTSIASAAQRPTMPGARGRLRSATLASAIAAVPRGDAGQLGAGSTRTRRHRRAAAAEQRLLDVGIAEHVGRRPLPHHPAQLHGDQPVGHLGDQRQVVLDDQDAAARL